MSGEFPGHSRTGIPLHSRNVLVHLELCHSARSCIKILPFCWNTTHSHVSVFQSHNDRRYDVFDANRMRNSMLNIFRPVSVQGCGAIRSRGLSLLRKVNGNMDSAKYQRDIIHGIEMTSECVVFPQVENICMHDLAPCHNSIKTRTFLECKGIPVLEWPRNSPDMDPIKNVSNIMKKEIGNQMPCIKEKTWK